MIKTPFSTKKRGKHSKMCLQHKFVPAHGVSRVPVLFSHDLPLSCRGNLLLLENKLHQVRPQETRQVQGGLEVGVTYYGLRVMPYPESVPRAVIGDQAEVFIEGVLAIRS